MTVLDDDEESVSLRADLLPPVAPRLGLLLLCCGPDAFVMAPSTLADAGEVTARQLLEHHAEAADQPVASGSPGSGGGWVSHPDGQDTMATYRKVCIDAVSPELDGPVLGKMLGLPWRPDERGEGGLLGPEGRYLVWFNAVPDAGTKSERVRLDIRSRRWRGIEVDSADPLSQATWWARVLDGTSQADGVGQLGGRRRAGDAGAAGLRPDDRAEDGVRTGSTGTSPPTVTS